MNNQTATTQSQSARLLRCGVSADTADMSIRTITEPMIKDIAEWETPLLLTMPYGSAKDIYRGDYVEPAWSLSALLGLLPKEIKVAPSPYDEIQRYGLLIYPFMGGWQVDYQYCEDDECHSLICRHGDNLIEACVKAIEWLSENNYKLNDPDCPCREKGGEK